MACTGRCRTDCAGMTDVVSVRICARTLYKGPAGASRWCKQCRVAFTFKGEPPKFCPCCSTHLRSRARNTRWDRKQRTVPRM